MGDKFLLVVLLASLCLVYCQPQSFNDNSQLNLPASYKNDWMKSISNNKKISHITIPGTHDAMARRGGISGGIAICQVWSVEDQLRAGIRYLDLRVKDNLQIVHGIIDQGITFTQVLNAALNFLNQHKSEAVLLRVKPEGNNKKNVQVEVQKVIKNLANVWAKSDVPSMGEARGKVILLQKNEFKLGLKSSGTDKNGDYKVCEYEKKMKKIKAHLNEVNTMCKNNENSDTVIVSYSSGTGAPYGLLCNTPKEVAKRINPWLNTHLGTLDGPCFGVIAMDFPGIDLIQSIVKLNDLVSAIDHITYK
ncbi:1-phosphatidylinositol phosphodiesterase-like [Engraulis encrasicolus]|uniref:1-phosphatidylinositol phosphodiesterase-like n=1 Tax=Engraulis encrasicolus TaxID=184585 RepID=UPI002FD0CF86